MVRPNGPRDLIAGPDTPQPPFPLKLRGPVIKGFGRGSKEVNTTRTPYALDIDTWDSSAFPPPTSPSQA